MRRINGWHAVILVCAFGLSSCATTDGSNTQDGAVIGAIAGALLGAALSEDKEKGALIGAAAGGLIGAGIGRFLDTRDRQRLAQSTEQTIVTGEAQTWSNPETGVSARTTVTATTEEPQAREIPVLKDRVEQTPPLEFIGESYVAKSASNVRGGPGTDYKVVGRLDPGTSTQVVGKVEGKEWYMVAEQNVANGFVATSLLPSGGTAPPPAQTKQIDASQVATANVQGTSDCRIVQQQVTLADGRNMTEDVKACRGPNGWEIVSNA